MVLALFKLPPSNENPASLPVPLGLWAAVDPNPKVTQGSSALQRFSDLRVQALRLSGVTAGVSYSPETLRNLSPSQEKTFIGAYTSLVNRIGNHLASPSSSAGRSTQSDFGALQQSITDAFEGDFRHLPSFRGSRNPFSILADKFGVALNITLDDFVQGNVSSVADLNDENGKFSGYQKVSVFNPFVGTVGSFVVNPKFSPEGSASSVRVYVALSSFEWVSGHAG